MIHNISIATDDDVIQFGDDVNIYPVYLSRAIIICGNCLTLLEKTIVSDRIFVNFLLADLGTHLWPLSFCVLDSVNMQKIFITSFLFGQGHLYPKQKINSVAHLEAIWDRTCA